MKFAIISDVHGNYPALIKVIEDAKFNKVDRFIFIGDYIFDLPFSNEVIHYLSKMENTDVVLGNKEKYLDGLSKENQSNWVFNQIGAIYQTYRELTPEAMNFISTLKECKYIPLENGGYIYANHYPKNMPALFRKGYGSSTFHKKMIETPFSHEQFLKDFATLIEQDSNRSAFDDIDAKVILMGHNHLQCYGYCGQKLIINPGSCGQPLDFDTRAAYTILEELPTGFNVIERRVEYNIEATINLSKKSMVYEYGTIWCELVFLAMRTGRDYFGFFFELATQIATTKGEKSDFFTNETWQQAYELFMK